MLLLLVFVVVAVVDAVVDAVDASVDSCWIPVRGFQRTSIATLTVMQCNS